MSATSAWHWYTRARRVPSLIGKDSAGRRIPGGPYTVLQVIAVPVTATLAWQTQGLWGAGMVALARIITVLVVTVATVKLLGKVDFASRNPVYLAAAYVRQAFGPAGGRLGTTPVKPQPLTRVRSSVQAATCAPRTHDGVGDDAHTVVNANPDASTADVTMTTAATSPTLSPPADPAPTPAAEVLPTSTPVARPKQARPARTRSTSARPTGARSLNTRPAGPRAAAEAAPATSQRQTGLEAFLGASHREDAA